MLIVTGSYLKFPYCECGGIMLWNVHSYSHLREEIQAFIDKDFEEQQEVFPEVPKEEFYYSIDELINDSEELDLSEMGCVIKYIS